MTFAKLEGFDDVFNCMTNIARHYINKEKERPNHKVSSYVDMLLLPKKTFSSKEGDLIQHWKFVKVGFQKALHWI